MSAARSSRSPGPRRPQEASGDRNADPGSFRRWWVLGGAALVMVLLVAVFATRPRVATQTGAADADPVMGSKVGDIPAAVEVTDLNGGRVRIPTASKPTAVYFVAAWCQTCVPEAQAWDRIQRSLGDQISVVVVDVDPTDTPQRLKGFIDLVGDPRYPFVIDTDATVARAYQLTSLDTTVIFDAAGTIVYRDGVPTPEATLREALAKAGVS